MKKLLFVLLVMAGIQHARAQTQTLFSNNGHKTSIGAYGTPSVEFASINGKFAVLTGGYGGVFLNKKIMLGAGAYSLVNNIATDITGTDGKTQYLNYWYTGLVAEYVHNSDKLVHWSVGALVGGGGVSRRERSFFNDNDNNDHFDKYHNYDRTGFFTAQPFANIELNVWKHIRFDVGASYRFVNGSHTEGTTDNDLSGPSVHAGIKAGIF